MLISTRSPGVQRLYFRCDPETTVEDWPDDKIWEEFGARAGAGGLPPLRPARSLRRTW